MTDYRRGRSCQGCEWHGETIGGYEYVCRRYPPMEGAQLDAAMEDLGERARGNPGLILRHRRKMFMSTTQPIPRRKP